ncbi:MAG: (2Fe-2S)-binding protein [Deltaproteobacteria bacterium]|nr:(2Fe-2S)-binding protein [Deltaproteobacteria bacterium]
MNVRIVTEVNGQTRELDVHPGTTLLDLLREQLGITSVRRGCEEGQCGACTVLLDDRPVYGCLTLAVQADGRRLTTVEGLPTPPGGVHPLVQAFVDHHGLQCGYCTSGLILAAYALLRRNEAPSPQEIRQSISGNLCRCTGYVNIERAVAAAAASKTAGEWPR